MRHTTLCVILGTIFFSVHIQVALAAPLTVRQLREMAPQKGTYELQAHVVKQYRCPPCPKGALCKPCMRDNILVSDEDTIQQTYPGGGNFLVILTPKKVSPELGKRYRLSVTVLQSSSTNYNFPDLELKSIQK